MAVLKNAYINFTRGTIVPPAPWVYNDIDINGLTLPTVIVPNINDDTNTPTGYFLEALDPFTRQGEVGASSNTGGWPANVFNDRLAAFTGTPWTLQIGGLDVGDPYTIELAGQSGTANDTSFTVDGVTKVYNGDSIPTPGLPVSFTGTTIASTIDISVITSGGSTGYLNGIKLTVGVPIDVTGTILHSSDSDTTSIAGNVGMAEITIYINSGTPVSADPDWNANSIISNNQVISDLIAVGGAPTGISVQAVNSVSNKDSNADLVTNNTGWPDDVVGTSRYHNVSGGIQQWRFSNVPIGEPIEAQVVCWSSFTAKTLVRLINTSSNESIEYDGSPSSLAYPPIILQATTTTSTPYLQTDPSGGGAASILTGAIFKIGKPVTTGGISYTNSDDIASIVGKSGLKSTIAFTSEADTSSIVAVSTISGTISHTSDDDVTDIIGNASADISGPVSFTSEADTTSISGTVASGVNVKAVVSFTEESDGVSASGLNTIYGTIIGEGSDTTDISVVITQPVFGDIVFTSANDSCDSTGAITQPVFGTVAFTNDSDECVISAVITQPIIAAIAYTEGNDTVFVVSELSFIINSEPVTMAKGEAGIQFVVSGVGSVPTTANTTIVSGSASLTVTSVTGTGPYTINCTVPIDIPKQAGSYPWTITINVEDVVSSAIPLTVQSGWDRVGLVSPVASIGYMLNGYENTAAVTGDDLEFEITSGFAISANSEWIWDAMPIATQVVNRRVVQAGGSVGATAAITFNV